jgi:hypothetical protein
MAALERQLWALSPREISPLATVKPEFSRG